MSDKAKLIERLDQWWFNSPAGSRWVNYGPVQVYLRKTPFAFRGQARQGITVANISVNLNQQRQGWCRTVLEWAARQDVEMIRVENVITPRMRHILETQGWESDNQYPPSFYLLCGK